MNATETAAERLETVAKTIAKAAAEARRPASDVRLVAVSKTFGPEEILPVLEAGQRVFGENRVQEAAGKWPALRERFGDLELHLIGPLQTNKVRDALSLFDAIHSLDRPKLAAELAKEIQKAGRAPQLFVQVNTGAEPQKAGVLPETADAFLAECRKTYALQIAGLMCIPPLDRAPAPHFALTAQIAKRNGLALLSMGMSADFAAAIAFGATHVRVGSAIFGERTTAAAG